VTYSWCHHTGWDDGRIRAYYPESGRPFYTMDNAYGGSVTALATLSDCRHVISGSNLGHVVVWEVPAPGASTGPKGGPLHVTRHFLLKEHKSEVTCIRARKNDTECISSSTDGSCIIWDLMLVIFVSVFRLICDSSHQMSSGLI